MSQYFYWDLEGTENYSHILKNYCESCKHRKKKGDASACSKLIYSNGGCLSFEWKSERDFEDYKNSVLEAQAASLYMDKGYTIWDIYKLSKEKLLSILPKISFKQFEDRIRETKFRLEEVNRQILSGADCSAQFIAKERKNIVAIKKPEEPEKARKSTQGIGVHLFYTKDKQGITKVYSRKLNSKGYKSDIKQLRKYIDSNGLTLLKEEIRNGPKNDKK